MLTYSDEFHHAVNVQYKRIVEYFTPKFLLGLTATPERIAELSSDKNRRGKALIKLVEEEKPETPKEPVENFINPPTEPVNPVEKEEKPVKPKRGRKKKD